MCIAALLGMLHSVNVRARLIIMWNQIRGSANSCARVQVSLFNVKKNGKHDYLSVGEDMLPTVYMVLPPPHAPAVWLADRCSSCPTHCWLPQQLPHLQTISGSVLPTG